MKHFMTRSLLAIAIGFCGSSNTFCQMIDFESKYLTASIAGFHGFRITGDLTSEAKLVMDPNHCSLDVYGDRQICTRIALVVQNVTLAELEIVDPTGLGRHIYAIGDHGLAGDLKLVTTAAGNDGWFVYTERNGFRSIIDLDSIVHTRKISRKGAPASCVPLPRTVENTRAKYKVVAGFQNGTWILILKGKKPNGGTRISFRPVDYVQSPDYWQINVEECSDGISIPVVTPYDESFEITPYLGKKGIELVFGDEKVRIDVPPTVAE